MKVAILETGHFQYALTQAEIFSDCEILFITTRSIKQEMESYAPELCFHNFLLIDNIWLDEKEIIATIEKKAIELLLISPVFDSYGSLKRIVKHISCKKVVTTHNINTWFYGRFWSPNSYMDRINMRAILKNCDYVAVEDFIFNHLKDSMHPLCKKNSFIYIPFTIFHQNRSKKYFRSGPQLKVVLTGAIDGARRRYEDVLQVVRSLACRKEEIIFSFAGKARGEYGQAIKREIESIDKIYPNFVSCFNEDATADMFRREMETSDIVLSVSNKTFKGMGTVEYIGKTKPTAAIHDMMSYELPGLLPEHLKVPDNLKGSVFNYNSAVDLIKILRKLLDEKGLLEIWKQKAKQNSLNFTADKIRKGLPF